MAIEQQLNDEVDMVDQLSAELMPESNLGREAQANPPASRRERKKVPVKERIAQLEETIHILGLAVLIMRGAMEQQLGKPVARQILPRG